MPLIFLKFLILDPPFFIALLNISFEKYNTLIKNGLLKDLIKKTTKHFEYNEWEIPKGRRNINESNKECAMREFEEETNININDYILCINMFT